jgi:hypothetical protein
MVDTTCVHKYETLVRQRGNRVRKRCRCGRVGPWHKPKTATPVVSRYDAGELSRMNMVQLKSLGKKEKVPKYSTMRKTDLIEALVALTC